MNASEKLRALGEEFQEVDRGNVVEVVPSDPRVGDRVRYVYPAEVKAARTRVGSALLAALPQIVAIVEAAEALPEFFYELPTGGRTHSFVPLLDALDEAL